MTQTELNILALSGSLRRESRNTALLKAVEKRLPKNVSLHFESIALPLYNSDLDSPEVLGPVERFKQAIGRSDAVLIATPEYNYSIPGVLKNALDWASRPAYKSVFVNKPVGIVGTSPSSIGTARAQGHLKQVLLGMAAQVYPSPEVTLGGSASLFSETLELNDERALERVDRFVEGFIPWIRRVGLADP